MYYYFPIVLAIGITTLNFFNENLYLESRNSQTSHESQLVTQATSTVDSSQQLVQKLSYAELMAAGSQAESDRASLAPRAPRTRSSTKSSGSPEVRLRRPLRERNYLQVIDYFRQALTLGPEDTAAQKALNNAVNHGFDFYTQAAYVADREREYQTVLKQFEKALTIKADSFYAKQAFKNLNFYISLSNQSESPVEIEPETTDFNQDLLLGAITVTSFFTGILLLLLFRKVEINVDLENLDHQEDDVVDDEVILEGPDSSQNVSTNNYQSSKQQDSQDKLLIAPDAIFAQLDLVPKLILELQSGDREIRHKTIEELAQSGDSRAMTPLVQLMIEADSQERNLILEAMTQITSSILKPMNQFLILSLGDENSQVENTIRDLNRMYELMSQVTERLSQTVNDSDQKVRETAEWALKQLKQMPEPSTWYLDSPIIDTPASIS